MIRHVALFGWRPGVGAERVREIRAALHGLPDACPEICAFACGPDLGLAEGNADFAVVADFEGPEGLAAYQRHPDHRRALEELILPAADMRAAIQIALPGPDPGRGSVGNAR